MKIKYLILCLLLPLLFNGCSDDPEFKGPGIHNYFCSSGRMRLGSGTRNASGITFNHDTGTLFLIQDSPVWIHEVKPSGKIIRTIRINNANDTEGIAYMGNELFAILEESSSKVYFCIINAKTNTLDLKKVDRVIKVNEPDENTGLEGITFLPGKKIMYAVKEKEPKVIYRIDYKTGKVDIPWDLNKINIDDVSDICYNPKNNSLLLLSHESRMIVEVDLNGNMFSRLVLEEKRNGLERNIKKAEGITIDHESGKIYICGEKEEFYVLEDATKK